MIFHTLYKVVEMLNTVIIIKKTKGTYGVLVHVQFQSMGFNGGGGGGIMNMSLNCECTKAERVYCTVWTGSLNQTDTVLSLKG